MAITIDTGDPKDVHPKLKKPVGERLAQWSLAKVYHHDVVAMGPMLKEPIEFGEQKIVVSFEYAGVGLKTHDGKPPRHFEVAGADEKFRPAIARINDRSQVVLTNFGPAEPVWVRYAWRPFLEPPTNLVNSVDIPASPFSSQTEEAILGTRD